MTIEERYDKLKALCDEYFTTAPLEYHGSHPDPSCLYCSAPLNPTDESIEHDSACPVVIYASLMAPQALTDVQEEFLTLLETTDQPQGEGSLCSSDGFCCLGLWSHYRGIDYELCEEGDDDRAKFIDGEDHETSVLLPRLVRELGLYTALGIAGGAEAEEIAHCITEMNDEGLTFKEIARRIRDNSHFYFKQPENTDE